MKRSIAIQPSFNLTPACRPPLSARRGAWFHHFFLDVSPRAGRRGGRGWSYGTKNNTVPIFFKSILHHGTTSDGSGTWTITPGISESQSILHHGTTSDESQFCQDIKRFCKSQSILHHGITFDNSNRFTMDRIRWHFVSIHSTTWNHFWKNSRNHIWQRAEHR